MYRIGIDLGGTKIELVALDDRGLVPSLHGDASGVRGAAWLWPQGTENTAS